MPTPSYGEYLSSSSDVKRSSLAFQTLNEQFQIRKILMEYISIPPSVLLSISRRLLFVGRVQPVAVALSLQSVCQILIVQQPV